MGILGAVVFYNLLLQQRVRLSWDAIGIGALIEKLYLNSFLQFLNFNCFPIIERRIPKAFLELHSSFQQLEKVDSKDGTTKSGEGKPLKKDTKWIFR